MNEIDFVQLSRSFGSGTPVLFFSADEEIRRDFETSINRAVAAGIVLRFVDPAKPLLVYRNAYSRATGIDFFQDALYAATPSVPAEQFLLWQIGPDGTGEPELDPWLRYLEALIQRPLRSDTQLFDAYSAGAFGTEYEDREWFPEGLNRWVRGHLELLSLRPEVLHPRGKLESVWEGHDVYTFN